MANQRANQMANQMANQVSEAEGVAGKWLALVDSGQYRASWQEMVAFARAEVSEAEMAEKLDAARKPLGQIASRALKQSTPLSAVEGAPDGEYVVLDFDSSFSNRPTLTERVTVSREADDSFRVAGYYLM